jgi:hypothetical protein
MIRRLCREHALLYCAPGLLCVVAAIQRYHVQNNHMNVWKGGGFGMFSTIIGNRTVSVTLLTSDNESMRVGEDFVVRHFRFGDAGAKRYLELEVLPSRARLQKLLTDIADAEWVAVRAEGAEYPLPKERARGGLPTRPIRLREATVEILEYRFVSSGPRIELAQVTSQSLQIP